MNPERLGDCRVCIDKSEGAHFGVDSCRACAAFFRRSVATNKSYICRQGGGRCLIRKNMRSMCRHCRFQKCLQSGMLPESVLNKRLGPVSSDCEDSTSNPKPETLPVDERVAATILYNLDVQPQTSSDSLRSASERPQLLEKIAEHYRRNRSVRRSTEISISRASQERMFYLDLEDTEPIAANYEMLVKIARITVPSIAEFINNAFETFTQLNQEDKWLLFKSFVPYMWNLESSYYSAMRNDVDEKRNLTTLTTYIDTQSTSFFDNCQTLIDKEDMRKLLAKGMDKNHQLVKYFRRLKLSETEFIAALGLFLWTPSLTNMDHEHIATIAEAERAKIFNDLHLYYKQTMGCDAYAQRLGEMMCMFSSLQSKVTYWRENMELFNLFDVFSTDTFVYDLVKC